MLCQRYALSRPHVFCISLLSFAVSLHTYWQYKIGWAATSKEANDSPISVAVVETMGAHEEVIAGFVHSFASQPQVNLSIYQNKMRFGMQDVMAEFDAPQPVRPPYRTQSFQTSPTPEIVVSTTCARDLRSSTLSAPFEALIRHGRTHLFCVIHHADEWNEDPQRIELLRPWLEKSLVTLIFLSPHTAEHFKSHGTTSWDDQALAKEAIENVDVFVPVFPIPQLTSTASEGRQSSGFYDSEESAENNFALQGNYQAHRRDFGAVFATLHQVLSCSSFNNTTAQPPPKGCPPTSSNTNPATLHLLGSGHLPKVPDNVKENVKFHEKLSFTDYYTLLAQQLAVLPAFASHDYYKTKASSTVPAALLSGAPLIATDELLQAYSYLKPELVWLQGSEESDADVMMRIMRTEKGEREEMKERIRARCEEVVEGNRKVVGERWLPRVRKRLAGG